MERITKFRDGEEIPAIIYNNDSDDFTYPADGYKTIWAEDSEPIPVQLPFQSLEDYLSYRLGPLDQTALPTISYCGNFGAPIWEIKGKNVEAIGDDPYNGVLQFWKAKPGRSFYFSMRMNDWHHEFLNPPHLWTEFRKETRSWYFNPPDEQTWKDGWLPWINGEGERPPLTTGDFHYDYSKPEVREHYLSVMEEALKRYDLDGVELDWLRHDLFFRDGEVSTRIMTDFVRDIRRLIDRYSELRGRRLRLVSRVRETPAEAVAVGLDVEAWLKEGLMDAIIAANGCLFATSPIEQWVHMAHAYGVPVYGCMERANFWHREFTRFGTPEGLRAAIATLWELGADAIYLFNFYNRADYPVLDSFADPALLAPFPKEYFTDSGVCSILPAKMERGKQLQTPLVLADDPAATEEIRLELLWKSAESDTAAPLLYINGVSVAPLGTETSAQDDGYLHSSVTTELEVLRRALKKGKNTLLLRTEAPATVLTVNVRMSGTKA